MLDKRAQGLSITVIVAAVIGLIIIVVLVMMLTGKLGSFSKGLDKVGGDATKTCQEIGGSVMSRDECIKANRNAVVSKDTIASPNTVCCSA